MTLQIPNEEGYIGGGGGGGGVPVYNIFLEKFIYNVDTLGKKG